MQSSPIGPRADTAWKASGAVPVGDDRGAAGLQRTRSAPVTMTSSAGAAGDALAAYEQHGGHVSVWKTSTGSTSVDGLAALGLALADDGTPDFDRIVADGGKLTGALPPLGAAKQMFNVDGRITTLYAAEVDCGDGSPPVFIKGADLRADRSSAGGQGRRDQVLAASRFLQQSPNTLSEARVLSLDGLRTWPSSVTRSVDIYT